MKNPHLFAVNATGIDSEKVKEDFEIHFFRRLKPPDSYRGAIQKQRLYGQTLVKVQSTEIFVETINEFYRKVQSTEILMHGKYSNDFKDLAFKIKN